MKKLTEFKDEQALDVLSEILDSAISLMADKEFQRALIGDRERNIKPNRVEAIKVCLKDHKKELVQIMAVLNETPVEEFHYNILTLPKMVLEIFNDKELVDFFKSQGTETSETSTGPATENTEETEIE